MRRNTGFVTSELAEPPTLNATSDGVYELTDQYYHATNEEWPVPPALRTMQSLAVSNLALATTQRTTSDAPLAPNEVVPTLNFYQNLDQTHQITIQGIDSDLYIKVVPGSGLQDLYDEQSTWTNIVRSSTNMPTSSSMETTLSKEAIPQTDADGVSMSVYNIMWEIKFIHIGTSDLPFDIEIYTSAARTSSDLIFTIPCLLKAVDVQPVTISGGTGQNNANSEPIFNEGTTAQFSFIINNLAPFSGNSSTDVNIYQWLGATTDTVDDFDATVDGAQMSAVSSASTQYPRIAYFVDIPITSDLLTEGTEKFEWITRIMYLGYLSQYNQWAMVPDTTIFDGVTPAGNADGVFAIEISDTSTTLPGMGSGTTASFPTSITEGSTYTLTITDTTNSSNTGDFYYSVVGNGGLSSADLSINTSTFYGPVQMTNGTVSISFDVSTDTASPETGESFTVFVSASDPNAIPFFNTTCTVTDVPPPTIDQHLIPAQLAVKYTTVSSDDTGNYDVYSFPVGNLPSNSFSNNRRIYIGVKIGTSTTFYNDVCIAAVQRLNSSGTVLNNYVFYQSTNSYGWTTTNSQSSTYSAAYPSTSAYPSFSVINSYSYPVSLNNTTANGVNAFTLASSTGSSTTGMNGGVLQTSGAYTVGTLTEAQTGSYYYAYREASGSTRHTFAFMRSPTITFSANDEIRVVAKFVTNSSMSGTFNADDILYVGITQ